jgi:hypothetical protein
MSYVQTKLRSEQYQRDSSGLISMADVLKRRSDESFFYEIEAAVVVDVVTGEDHPVFKSSTPSIDIGEVPPGSAKPSVGDVDYTWIGRCRVRPIESMQRVEISALPWAFPMEGTSGINELPVVGEVVLTAKYLNKIYYTRKINLRGFAAANADFRLETIYGTASSSFEYRNDTLMGPVSSSNVGSVGRYMKANNNIRALLPYEGDTTFESRHGQSIRMGAYDNVRTNDTGSGIYDGCGNPMILIRNRQRAPLTTGIEKNVGGRILEDINLDGTSIYVTSGITKILGERGWENPVAKKIFESGMEENAVFSPTGCTSFKWTPRKYDGDQVFIQSGRMIFASKTGETFVLSKKRLAMATDGELTLDAADQLVATSNKLMALNSPYIFLGDYGVTEEPVVLGRSLVLWLADLVEWLKKHQHDYEHKHTVINHKITSSPTPLKTQTPPGPDISGLNALASVLPSVLSERVFTVKGPPSAGATLPVSSKSGLTPIHRRGRTP